jgi:hypothetical protein
MNLYEYWQKAIADPKALRAREFRITTEPQPGFYRDRRGKGIAIFWDAQELVIQRNGVEVDGKDHETVWLGCATRPVSEEAFEQFMETGKWADMDASVQASLGDNIANAEDVDALQELMQDLLADLSDYDTISDDDEASRAAGLRNRINELKLRADKLRKDEKEPHLRAGQAVDVKWQPVIKDATSATERLRKSISSWETTKLKAAREAEAARLRAEAANQPPPQLPSTPEPATQVRPAYGRAQAVKVVNVVTGIDVAVLVPWMVQHDREALSEFLESRAQHHVNRGVKPDGVTTEEQARV